MKLLNPAINTESFFAALKGSPNRALLMDYDGTMAPFKEERSAAFPYPGVRGTLKRILKDRHTRVIIISGRSLKDLIPLLRLDPLPEIWGSHGGERLLSDGTHLTETLTGEGAESLKSTTRGIKEMGWEKLLERKSLGLAIHWRGLKKDRIEEIRRRVTEIMPPDLEKIGLSLHSFDGGLELRPSGVNKGDAVRTILNEMGDGVPVAYLGDDLTDEDAFEAVKNRGLGVLVRDRLRETKADLWLRPPDELVDFLHRWASLDT